MQREYGTDVLAGNWRRAGRPEPPEVEATRGLVVEEADGTGFCGAVVACEKNAVTLEDRSGRQRVFPLTRAGFLLDGQPVTLTRPVPGKAKGPQRTASGALARPAGPAGQAVRARVARASRIYVEGRHDAELVERIWGDDLRDVGVVVEYLEGVDHLPAVVASFAPAAQRRLGVLVDHLVPGSKEQRIADQVSSPAVLVVGHPYVDIWQAVKPAAIGIAAWPDVPRGTPWKEGVLQALGWGTDTAAGWKRILAGARSYSDLEPELLGRVEELIDFVTAPGTG